MDKSDPNPPPVTAHPLAQGVSRRRLLQASGAGLVCLPFSRPLWAQALPARGGLLRAAFTGKSSAPLNVLTVTQSPLVYVRARMIWDSLAELADGKLHYRVMQSAEPDRAATRWHIKIRPKITFSNGQPLLSGDVLHSLRTLAAHPTVQSGLLEMVDFSASTLNDAHSLTLVLKQPVGAFDLHLATAMFIFPQQGEPVGSGGWQLTDCNENFCTLKPRKDYWDETRPPRLDEIQLYGIDDMTARVNGLKAGQFDYIGSVPLIYARNEQHNPAVKVIIADPAQWGDLGFIMNSQQPPFNQPDVVQALRLSIDRNAMVKTLTFGMGAAGNDLLSNGKASPFPVRPYDPQKAQSLLKRAGLTSINQSILTSNYEWGMVESATLFIRQAKPAGFNFTINKVPTSEYYADLNRLINASIKVIKFENNSFPMSLLNYYGSRGKYPFSGAASQKLDQLLDNLQRAKGEAISGAMEQVQEYLYYHGSDAFFVRMPQIALSTPALQGVDSLSSFNYPYLGAAWFEL